MTSFIIKSHVDRPPSWEQGRDCTFCRIIRNEISAYRLYEDEQVIAILDILPLRKGHTLVIPKAHYSRLSDLPLDFAAATGIAVSKVARALTEALGNTGLNVVCNQEYAQAVPHVHYHIIPAPQFASQSSAVPKTTRTADLRTTELITIDPKVPLTMKQMHKMEFESREELDEEDADVLATRIRARL